MKNNFTSEQRHTSRPSGHVIKNEQESKYLYMARELLENTVMSDTFLFRQFTIKLKTMR